ncbi:pirin family protein [Cochleicola gelatinilyticus]|uniref:Short-chain dehydrogenase n=1 Tax=Cochleicola gelatinilyticus TaxID=1763537 RepID=A0A167IRE8_9FLAO|nr:pirin family protein [Cochleicola gelatinilyticus]OAB79938.1 short-chain dehydrogenase [Cochleicola gelatinilyticus]
MSTKNIELIAAPGTPHFVGDGFRVHNLIPNGIQRGMERMSPFILLDYNSKFYFPPSEQPKGVGVHPHRGFETVTIAYKGRVAHHDSSGGGGVIKEGGVQWMTAASGVLHKEYHEASFSKKGGDFQMVQLWVNLPAKDKMSTPKYQALTQEDLATYSLPQNNGTIEIIAGSYNEITGPATTFTPIHMFNARLQKGANVPFTFPANYNTCLLVIEGEITVNQEETVATDHLVLFKNEGDTFSVEASEDAIVLILSGEPIQEPIAAQGPFVMNTQAELIQAMNDFNMGKFGYLED